MGCSHRCCFGIEIEEENNREKSFVCWIWNADRTVREKIKELNLLEYCSYLGPKTHQELNELYHQADVMIFPTMLYESLGLVGLEAMACGCPVIGSNIGCLPEYVKDGVTGFLFESGNSHELADKIINFYELSISQREKCN